MSDLKSVPSLLVYNGCAMQRRQKIKSEPDTRRPNEERPLETLFLSRMSFWRLLSHFAAFFMFIIGLFVATSLELERPLTAIATTVGLVLLAVLSFIPWLRDMHQR
jgi:hypothetical protein